MGRERCGYLIAAIAGIVGAISLVLRAAGGDGAPEINRPPESLKVDVFYRKYVSAGGLAIVSSEKVADAALLKALELINRMLADRPDILAAMVDDGVRFVVIGANEQVTDIPEYSHMEPKEFWNQRARGFGGRVVSCGEENLLCYPIDRYDDESILIHEFSHCIQLAGLRRVEKDFDKRLDELYKKAVDGGLWKWTYAGSNVGEYWAEGVQSYYDANRQNNYNHNHVNTREELEAYDPHLARLVGETFRHTEKTDWRYRPAARQPGITSPPAELKCAPFYKKYVYVRGFAVLGGERVSDEALLEANYLIRNMFAYRNDILKAITEAGVRLVVVGRSESIADVPECGAMERAESGWRQTRVAGCTAKSPAIVCAEENLLCDGHDPHSGESVVIREFARAALTIAGRRPVENGSDKRLRQQYELGLKRIDIEFDEKVRGLYKAATEKGLWKGTVAGEDHEAYWAEAVQSWFDANVENCRGHNHVNTRKELEVYDPELAALVEDVFRHSLRTDWSYMRPQDRR